MGGGVRPLDDWLAAMEREAKAQTTARQNMIIIGVIGRDTSTRAKTEDINETLDGRFLDSWPSWQKRKSSWIDAYFSLDYGCLFLVCNSYKDTPLLAEHFEGEEDGVDFFARLASLDAECERQLAAVFSLAHAVLVVENACRFELSTLTQLASVNRIRQQISSKLRSSADPSLSDEFKKNGARFSVPLLLFSIPRNFVRTELGASKRREIYEKLQTAMEEQIQRLLRHFRLISAPGDYHSTVLARVPPGDSDHFVFIHESAVLATDCGLGEMLAELLAGGQEPVVERKQLATQPVAGSTFRAFLRGHIRRISKDSKEDGQVYQTPSTAEFCAAARAIADAAREIEAEPSMEGTVIQALTTRHHRDAVSTYLPNRAGANILSRREHEQRLAAVLRSAECIAPCRTDWTALKEECERLWTSSLRGCETRSLSGRMCKLPLHPSIGDSSVEPSKWQLHSSSVQFISACNCGRTQLPRRDPFTLKEANCDFYSAFLCCRKLAERHAFPIAGEGAARAGDEVIADLMLGEEAEWPEATIIGKIGGAALSSTVMSPRAAGDHAASGGIDEGSSEESIPDEEGAAGDEREHDEERDDSEAEEEEEKAMQWSHGGTVDKGAYLEEAEVVLRDPMESIRQAAIQDVEHRRRLQTHSILFMDGVPHSDCPAPPLFSSWSLVCLGASSLYSHSTGIRGQSGFIGGTHLLPLDVHLQVDALTWARDMDYVESRLGTLAAAGAGSAAAFARAKRSRKGVGGTEKVKLFIGVEYECERGHRQFMQPSISQAQAGGGGALSQQQAQQSSLSAAASLLSSDLPLFQPCVYRKQPCECAQLMRVHVVTPKAPVTVTVDPKVVDTSSPSATGHFTTGDQQPLPLAWSRYYVLRFPWAYEGPNGSIPRPNKIGTSGTVKGNFISVTYTPLASWM